MKTVNSISGGRTSAYLAKHFPADYNLFALVRTEDKTLIYPDKKVRQIVEDRIQKPFIGTLEDDLIITTILELEQFLGQKINWVSGITYDEVIKTKGGWLPNKLHRYCTTHMKIEPQFYWWAENIGVPVEMRLGYRFNEQSRKQRSLERLNDNGLSTFKATFEKNKRGQNKWEEVEWQKPSFPLIDIKPTFKDEIVEYWKDKPVQFADYNNCVGCFHRHPMFLKLMFLKHPKKMQWFLEQEKIKIKKDKRATWRSDCTYNQIKEFRPQSRINFDEMGDCDSGYCLN